MKGKNPTPPTGPAASGVSMPKPKYPKPFQTSTNGSGYLPSAGRGK